MMDDSLMLDKEMKNEKSEIKNMSLSTSALIRSGSRSKLRQIYSKRASQSIAKMEDRVDNYSRGKKERLQ